MMGVVKFAHRFACELDAAKQECACCACSVSFVLWFRSISWSTIPHSARYIQREFPSLKLLFRDITLLHQSHCCNIATKHLLPAVVPSVQIFIAGTSCKSMSAANTDRHSGAISRAIVVYCGVCVCVCTVCCTALCTLHCTIQPTRSEYRDCISDGSGTSGETFFGMLGYVRTKKPQMVMLENVTGVLAQQQAVRVHSKFHCCVWVWNNSKLALHRTTML